MAAAFGFFYGYYSGGVALVNALNAVEGDLSNNHEALRAELAGMTLELPYGPVSLDENRHGSSTCTSPSWSSMARKWCRRPWP